MRKLKTKLEKVNEEEKTEVKEVKKIKKIDKIMKNISFFVFFLLAVVNDRPLFLIQLLAIILLIILLINIFYKKLNDGIKRFLILVLISIIAWPIGIFLRKLGIL